MSKENFCVYSVYVKAVVDINVNFFFICFFLFLGIQTKQCMQLIRFDLLDLHTIRST